MKVEIPIGETLIKICSPIFNLNRIPNQTWLLFEYPWEYLFPDRT